MKINKKRPGMAHFFYKKFNNLIFRYPADPGKFHRDMECTAQDHFPTPGPGDKSLKEKMVKDVRPFRVIVVVALNFL